MGFNIKSCAAKFYLKGVGDEGVIIVCISTLTAIFIAMFVLGRRFEKKSMGVIIFGKGSIYFAFSVGIGLGGIWKLRS